MTGSGDTTSGTSMGADASGAAWLPTTHYWPGRPHGAPRWIIIHGTGYSLSQTAADVMRDFQTTNANSAHYAIGRAGDIAQGVHERDSAWANGPITGTPGTGGPAAGEHDAWWDALGYNPNYATISIEHVNDNANGTPLTPAQQAVSFALIAGICRRWSIPMRPADAQGGITGHYSMDPINRARCPGTYPWQALWAYLAAQGQGGTGGNMRWLRNGRTACLSEFQGYNGDCTQTAHLSALHCIDPVAHPMTPAALNALVARDVAHGWAAANGSQNDVGLANSLRLDGVPFHQVSPSSGVTGGDWAAELARWGGIKPIILQVAAAGGHLPGDEAGVQGHAIACVAWDPQTNDGWFCDGDHPNAAQPVSYTLGELRAAQPFCVSVLDVEVPDTMGATTVDVTGLGSGFADYARARNVQGAVKVRETPLAGGPPGACYAVLGDNTLLYYAPGRGVSALPEVGAAVVGLTTSALAAQVAADGLRSQLAAATAADNADRALAATLHAQLETLSNKIAVALKDLAS